MDVDYAWPGLPVAGFRDSVTGRNWQSNGEELSSARFEGKPLLLPRGRQPILGRENPELHQVQRLSSRGVVFGVTNSRPRAHPLDLARGNLPGVSQAVAVFQRAGDDIGHNLHFTVAVHRKTAARSDHVVVEDAQRPEGDILRVMVMGEREMPSSVQPVRLETVALGVRNNLEHKSLLCERDEGLDATPLLYDSLTKTETRHSMHWNAIQGLW